MLNLCKGTSYHGILKGHRIFTEYLEPKEDKAKFYSVGGMANEDGTGVAAGETGGWKDSSPGVGRLAFDLGITPEALEPADRNKKC